MSSAAAPPTPGNRRHRVDGVDVARAIALLGMAAVHTLPRLDPDGSVSTAYFVAGGRSSAMFAVLAGVGLALASGGVHPPTARRQARLSVAVVVRAISIGAIGVLLASVPDQPVAVILTYYAAMFVLAVPFLGLRARALALWSVATAMVVPPLSHLVRDSLPAARMDSPDLDWADRGVLDAASELTLTGIYPALPWMTYIFAGMAVGRLALDAATGHRLLVGGALLAVGCWGLSRVLLAAGGLDALRGAGGDRFGRPLEVALESGLFGVTPTTTWWWLAVASPHSATPLDLLGTTGSALAVLGLMLLLVRGQWWWLPLRAAGSMPLTLYSLHVVMLATVLPRDTPNVYLWHVLVLLGLATWWSGVVGRGPLEAGTRWLAVTAAQFVVPVRRSAGGSTGVGSSWAGPDAGVVTGARTEQGDRSGGTVDDPQLGSQHEQPRQDPGQGEQHQ
jgi:uncharacterized membrane protein